FYGKRDESLALYVNRRPSAIPHYTIELERSLTNLPAPPPNIVVVGNYLGRIGLAKLIERAAVVAEHFRNSPCLCGEHLVSQNPPQRTENPQSSERHRS